MKPLAAAFVHRSPVTEVVHLRPELLDVPWSALLVAMRALFLGG